MSNAGRLWSSCTKITTKNGNKSGNSISFHNIILNVKLCRRRRREEEDSGVECNVLLQNVIQ